MNTKNNQRFQDTERKIKRSFLDLLYTHPLRTVPVGDVCRVAAVNRSTFYAHYDSAEMLLEAMNEDMTRQLAAVFEQQDNASANDRTRYLIPYLYFLLEHKDFYRAYFCNSRQYSFKHDLQTICRRSLQRCMEKSLPQEAQQADLILTYHTAGIYALIRAWVNRDFDLSPEELADVLVSCIPNVETPAKAAEEKEAP